MNVLARAMPGRAPDALQKRSHALIVHRRPAAWFRGSPRWSEMEDDALQARVRAHGRQWSAVAAHFVDRSAPDCRRRFEEYSVSLQTMLLEAYNASEAAVAAAVAAAARPRPVRDGGCRWTPAEEQRLLYDGHVNCRRPNWRRIAEDFPGRSPASVRARWGRLMGVGQKEAVHRKPQRCKACGRLRAGHVCHPEDPLPRA